MLRPRAENTDAPPQDKAPAVAQQDALPAPLPAVEVSIPTRRRILAFAVLIPLLLTAILYLLFRSWPWT